MADLTNISDIINTATIGDFGNIITYSIVDDQSDIRDEDDLNNPVTNTIVYYGNLSEEFANYPLAFSPLQQTRINEAVEEIMTGAPGDAFSVLFTDVLNISLLNTSTNLNFTFDPGETVGDIVIGLTQTNHARIQDASLQGINPSDVAAFTYPSTFGSDFQGDIWLNTDMSLSEYGGANIWDFGAIVPGTSAYETLVHEIGHALGLAHPLSGSPIDNQKYTIMSYGYHADMYQGTDLSATVFPSGLQLYDIAALQSIMA